VLLGEIVSVHK